MSGLWMYFAYVREQQELFNEKRILSWLNGLAWCGFHIASNIGLDFVDNHDGEAFAAPQQQAFAAAGVISDIQRFCAGKGEKEYFAYEAYSPKNHFDVDLTLSPSDGLICLCIDNSQFQPLYGGSAQRYSDMLALIEVTHRVWSPVFGFADNEFSTSREDALANQLRYLYGVNTYGPDLVAKLGRERLLSAPVWRITSQEDGGIMLVCYPFEDDPADPQSYDIAQIAQYLGLTPITQLWRENLERWRRRGGGTGRIIESD